MAIEEIPNSIHGLLVRELRDIANAIESKPASCIITRIPTNSHGTSYRIITGFERDDWGRYSVNVTELIWSLSSRVPPQE